MIIPAPPSTSATKKASRWSPYPASPPIIRTVIGRSNLLNCAPLRKPCRFLRAFKWMSHSLPHLKASLGDWQRSNRHAILPRDSPVGKSDEPPPREGPTGRSPSRDTRRRRRAARGSPARRRSRRGTRRRRPTPRGHDLSAQERQHDVAPAEDERAGAVDVTARAIRST